MWYVIKEDELYHHGILGQKWGVRRFQNYDGTYTQAGLKRYNKSSDQYNKTVHDYKTGKASKYEVKSARKKMNSDYRQLKRDKLADQGKELYKKGKRITSNTSALAVAGVASAFGGTAAYKIVRNYASEKVAAISGASVAVGAIAVKGILGAKSQYENRRLRAFYSH